MEMSHSEETADVLRTVKELSPVQIADWIMDLKSVRDVQEKQIQELRREVEGLQAFKRSVDEALNSGDGTYRP